MQNDNMNHCRMLDIPSGSIFQQNGNLIFECKERKDNILHNHDYKFHSITLQVIDKWLALKSNGNYTIT